MELLTDIFTWATGLIDSLTALVTDSPLTYLVIFAMAALDVLIMVIPAEATITASAVLAGQGTLNVVWIMVAAGLGAFVGDNVAYWIGRAAGRPLVEKVLRGAPISSTMSRRSSTGAAASSSSSGGSSRVGARPSLSAPASCTSPGCSSSSTTPSRRSSGPSRRRCPGFIGGRLIQDQPWLAMVIGFALSAALAVSIALAQHWWERRRRAGEPTADEVADASPDEPQAESESLKRYVLSRVTGVPKEPLIGPVAVGVSDDGSSQDADADGADTERTSGELAQPRRGRTSPGSSTVPSGRWLARVLTTMAMPMPIQAMTEAHSRL